MDALYVKKGFSDFITKLTQKPKHHEQRHFLLHHERRHIAETNALKEIKSCSLKWGARFNRKKMDQLIEAAATIFCDCAIAAKMNEIMSDAERARQIAKAGELEETQRMVDEMAKEAQSTAIHGAGADIPNVGKKAGPSNLAGELGCGGSHGPKILTTGGDSGGSQP